MTQELTVFPTPSPGKISLVIAPRDVLSSLMVMVATLALNRRVIVLDGGNCFDGYGLARALRRRTHLVQEAMERIALSRAFTCYQMLAVLTELPLDGTPIIILDMLSTFLDENVNLTKRQQLLSSSLTRLERISAGAPVAVWARSRSTPAGEDRQLLIPLRDIAHDIWEMQKPEPSVQQLSLF